jgi:hypothetical protein
MVRLGVAATCAMITMASVPSAAIPQSPGVPIIQLRPATARLSVGFSDIVSIVELSDGRALLTDRLERRLAVADFRSGVVESIGRLGEGPGEYTSVGEVLSLGKDSSLVVDWKSGRWLVLSRDRIVGTIPVSSPAYASVGGNLLGADARGHFLANPPIKMAPGAQAALADSMSLILVDARTGSTQSIGRIGPRASKSTVTFDERGKVVRFALRNPVLAVEEQPILFNDGWVGVARLQPYRVDWRTAQGSWIRGTAFAFREEPLSERDKEAYRNYFAAIGEPISPNPMWAPTLPPFLPSVKHRSVVAGPDGLLLIARVPTAAQFQSRYDVVDRRGALVAQIALPVNQRIVSFGAQGVYVVTGSELGLQYISRHPLPVFSSLRQPARWQ